jgi:hypothetical protein
MSLIDYLVIAAVVALLLAGQAFLGYVAGLRKENAALKQQIEKEKRVSEHQWIESAMEKFFARQERGQQSIEVALYTHLQSVWETSPHVAERAIEKFVSANRRDASK